MALPGTAIRHKFTHFELRAEVSRYVVRTAPTALNPHRELEAYPLSEAEELALPTPWRKLLMAEQDQTL
jgi:adenine-specific DNA glycosylase